MKQLRVLVACEFSGVVRDAFLALGHDAMSCDLLPSDTPGPHYQGDVCDLLQPGHFDLMIAHPPCTWLCAAMRTNAARKDRPNVSDRYQVERQKGLEFALLLFNAPVPRVCLENPIGYINSAFRKPDQIIRPFMFGHPYKKDICLWLKGLPPLFETDRVLPPYKTLDFWSKARNPNGRSLKSITFAGVAKAMAAQWSGYLQNTD